MVNKERNAVSRGVNSGGSGGVSIHFESLLGTSHRRTLVLLPGSVLPPELSGHGGNGIVHPEDCLSGVLTDLTL